MKILRPIAVTGGVLANSSVPLPVTTGADPDPALWLVGTSYALDAEVRDSTRRYRSRASANAGNVPATTPDKWLDMGPVNRLAMFDQSLGTATSANEQIAITLAPTTYMDTISLMGVDADTVRVQVAGSPFDVTHTMLYPRAVTNMHEYRFEPFERSEKLLITGLPVGVGVQITLTLSKPGGVAKCAMCVPGLVRQFGHVEFGLQAGIKDYSVKTTDRWGAPTLLEGGYSDRITLSAQVPNTLIDALKRALTAYRATPVVWIAWDRFEMTQVYGTFRDFGIVIPNAVESKCSLEIEGFAYAT